MRKAVLAMGKKIRDDSILFQIMLSLDQAKNSGIHGEALPCKSRDAIGKEEQGGSVGCQKWRALVY